MHKYSALYAHRKHKIDTLIKLITLYVLPMCFLCTQKAHWKHTSDIKSDIRVLGVFPNKLLFVLQMRILPIHKFHIFNTKNTIKRRIITHKKIRPIFYD